MNLKHVALLCLVSAVTGLAGFYAGVLREPGTTRLPRGSMLALDYLASVESFSEVEAARAALEGLAARYTEHARSLIAEEILSRSANSGVRQSTPERPMVAAIHLLDEVMPEFDGTGAELQLLPPLLYALKHERRYDRWLDVYLDALYRHPTASLVGDLTEEAVVISQTVSREDELSTALRHLSDIPLNSLDKSRIELSLVRVRASTQVTAKNHACHL
jgi:hypothetical protein